MHALLLGVGDQPERQVLCPEHEGERVGLGLFERLAEAVQLLEANDAGVFEPASVWLDARAGARRQPGLVHGLLGNDSLAVARGAARLEHVELAHLLGRAVEVGAFDVRDIRQRVARRLFRSHEKRKCDVRTHYNNLTFSLDIFNL